MVRESLIVRESLKDLKTFITIQEFIRKYGKIVKK